MHCLNKQAKHSGRVRSDCMYPEPMAWTIHDLPIVTRADLLLHTMGDKVRWVKYAKHKFAVFILVTIPSLAFR